MYSLWPSFFIRYNANRPVSIDYNMYYIKINFGAQTVKYLVRYKETLQYLAPYWKPCKDRSFDVSVSEEDFIYYDRIVPSNASPSYREYKILLFLTGKELIRSRMCIFHGVAFLWKNKVWIITAPSGTGKTTQFRLWNKLYGPEIKLICGDMPALEYKEDGRILVQPTPWNGKERYGNTYYSGEVWGIILLEQGKENIIERLAPNEAVKSIFLQMASVPDTKKDIDAVASMERDLLCKIPVWKLINRGDIESARITHEVLLEFISGRG